MLIKSGQNASIASRAPGFLFAGLVFSNSPSDPDREPGQGKSKYRDEPQKIHGELAEGSFSQENSLIRIVDRHHRMRIHRRQDLNAGWWDMGVA